MEWLLCGKIGRAVGLHGDVTVKWFGGKCPVAVGGGLFLAESSDPKTFCLYHIAALRKQGRLCLVNFQGVSGRSEARELTHKAVYVKKADLPAPEPSEYYCYQIIGMDVFTEEGRFLGKVEKIFSAGETDVYEVRSGEKEILLPAVDNVIMNIDTKSGRVTVRLLEGMEE